MVTVYLHGFLGSPDDWPRRPDSEPTGDAVALALPGHRGARGPQPASFREAVTQLLRQLQRRGSVSPAAPAHLVGYSLGARLALGMALAQPRLWQRVSLIGVHPGLSDAAARQARAQRDAQWCRLLRRGSMATFLTAWHQQPVFASQARPGRLAAAQRSAWQARRLAQAPQALAAMLAATSLARMPNHMPALAHLAVPLHLLVGAEDDLFLRLARSMLAQAPRATLTVLPACGHNPLLEAPAALLASLAQSTPVAHRGTVGDTPPGSGAP